MATYKLLKSGSRKLKYFIVGTVLILAVGTGIVVVRKAYTDNLKAVSSSEKSQLITINEGATVKEIAGLLESKSVIRAAWAFEWYVRNNDSRDKLQAGTYALKPSQDVKGIVDILTGGHIATDLVTLLPGKRLDEIRDKLINDGFDAAKVDAALEPSLYTGHPALVDKPAEATLEGYLYPETFQRTAETTPQAVIGLSLDEMAKRLTPELRANVTRQGLTMHQGIILASIVEGEVPEVENRPIVAQVFLKRLAEGMKLESNATDRISALLGEHYDTYEISGLPPGPISNVTESSLKAVASPTSTDWLYFVSGKDCVTRFGRTLEDHTANIQAHGVRKNDTPCPSTD